MNPFEQMQRTVFKQVPALRQRLRDQLFAVDQVEGGLFDRHDIAAGPGCRYPGISRGVVMLQQSQKIVVSISILMKSRRSSGNCSSSFALVMAIPF